MDLNTQRLVEIATRRKQIATEITNAKDKKALEGLEVEIRNLNEETTKIKEAQLQANTQKERELNMNKDLLPENVSYRNAFRKYFMSNDKEVLSMRADAKTTTNDTSAIIPTTIVDNIIRELAQFGDILPLVTFTNYKGGVRIPIAGTKPTASWVAEGTTSDRQKQEVTGFIEFGYYKLQLQVSITLLADTVTLDNWEALVAQNIAEAFAVALETAVIEGSGSGQPLGIIKDTRVLATNTHDFAIADATYQGFSANLIGKMPLAYRKGNNVIVVNSATWDKYMAGMMDEYGQPVGRVNYGINGEEQLRFFGKPVILFDGLPSLDDATEGDIVFLFMDFANYMINTNLGMSARTYIDEDTDEIVRKTTMIADGKLADVNGVVVLKKA